MTHMDIIHSINNMDNGERIKLFIYLRKNHFHSIKLTDEEAELLSAYRAGELEGIDEYEFN